MLRSSLMVAASAAALASPVAAVADDGPIVLERSTNWNVDFATNKCRLAAAFGEGEDRHILFLEQYGPDEAVGLTVAGPSFRKFRSRRDTELHFYEGQKPHETEPFTGDVEDVGDAVIYSSVNLEEGVGPADGGEDADDESDELPGLEQLDTAFAERVQFVALKQRGPEVRFATGPLDDAFEVMNQCTQDLVREMGLDVESLLAASRGPDLLNAEYVARRIQRQYSSAALSRGEQGMFYLRLIVNEQGAMDDCFLFAATTTEKLDSPACKEFARAKFAPALDADGEPMRSYYATRITYMIN